MVAFVMYREGMTKSLQSLVASSCVGEGIFLLNFDTMTDAGARRYTQAVAGDRAV